MRKAGYTKAQAMIELAILAPLVLVAFGLVATYVAKLNNDQWELMRAFRYALWRAHDSNKSTSFGTWDDRRMVSVTEPIVGQKTTSSGAACVNWVIEDVNGEGQDPDDTTIVKINGGAIPYMYEYDLGSGQSGGIEPMYFTTKSSSVNVTTNNNHVSSTRSAGVGEAMIYKIGDSKRVAQGRGHGASRSSSTSF